MVIRNEARNDIVIFAIPVRS